MLADFVSRGIIYSMSNQETGVPGPKSAAEKINLINKNKLDASTKQEVGVKEEQEEEEFQKIRTVVVDLVQELEDLQHQAGEDGTVIVEEAKKAIEEAVSSMRGAIDSMDADTKNLIKSDKDFKKDIFGDDKEKYYGAKRTLKHVKNIDEEIKEKTAQLKESQEKLQPLLEEHKKREAIKLQERVTAIKEEIKPSINKIVTNFSIRSKNELLRGNRNYGEIQNTYFDPVNLNKDIQSLLYRDADFPVPGAEASGFVSNEYLRALAEIFYAKLDSGEQQKFKNTKAEDLIKKEIAARFKYHFFQKDNGEKLEKALAIPRFNEYLRSNEKQILLAEKTLNSELEKLIKSVLDIISAETSSKECKDYVEKSAEMKKMYPAKGDLEYFTTTPLVQSIPSSPEDTKILIAHESYTYKFEAPFINEFLASLKGELKNLGDKKIEINTKLQAEKNKKTFGIFSGSKKLVTELEGKILFLDSGIKLASGLMQKIERANLLNELNEIKIQTGDTYRDQTNLTHTVSGIQTAMNEQINRFNTVVFENKLPKNGEAFTTGEFFSKFKHIFPDTETENLQEQDRKLSVSLEEAGQNVASEIRYMKG